MKKPGLSIVCALLSLAAAVTALALLPRMIERPEPPPADKSNVNLPQEEDPLQTTRTRAAADPTRL